MPAWLTRGTITTPAAGTDCASLFFFTHPATPEIYTLSLHDALPISGIQANLVTLLEGPALETAEAADGEGRAASHVLGNVERSADRDVRPEAGALEHLHLEQVAGLDGDALPERQGRAVEGRLRVRAGEGEGAPIVEARLEPSDHHLERGRALRVADEQIGGAECEVVHRARRVRAEVEIAHATREILHGGLDTAFEDLEHACPSLLWNRDLLHRLGLSALEGGNLGLDRLEEFQI